MAIATRMTPIQLRFIDDEAQRILAKGNLTPEAMTRMAILQSAARWLAEHWDALERKEGASVIAIETRRPIDGQ